MISDPTYMTAYRSATLPILLGVVSASLAVSPLLKMLLEKWCSKRTKAILMVTLPNGSKIKLGNYSDLDKIINSIKDGDDYEKVAVDLKYADELDEIEHSLQQGEDYEQLKSGKK